MRRRWLLSVVLLSAVAAAGAGQAWGPRGYPYYGSGGKKLSEMTIQEQRQLGLSDAQIKQIAEKRRAIERQRAQMEKQLEAARATVRAANAEVVRLQREMRRLLPDRLEAVYKAVMTKEQFEAWQRQRDQERARLWLRSYARSLKLSDEQVDDIAMLLAPVFAKYDKLGDEQEAAEGRLAERRLADPIDVAAIEAAEKQVADLRRRNNYRDRHNALLDALRAGLLPDQQAHFDRIFRWRR